MESVQSCLIGGMISKKLQTHLSCSLLVSQLFYLINIHEKHCIVILFIGLSVFSNCLEHMIFQLYAELSKMHGKDQIEKPKDDDVLNGFTNLLQIASLRVIIFPNLILLHLLKLDFRVVL